MFDREEGSISVEAAIIFPLVLFLILGFVSIIQYVSLAEKLDFAVKNTAIELSMDMYIYHRVGALEAYQGAKSELDQLVPIIGEKVDELVVKQYLRKHINTQMDGLGVYAHIQDDVLEIKVSADFKSHHQIYFGVIPLEKKTQVRCFTKGDSLKEYGFIKGIHYTDFDVWTFSNLQRGITIGEILGNNLGYTEYGLDILKEGTLTSIVSIDIRKESYQKRDAITNTLRTQINKLSEFSEAKVGEISIAKEDYIRKQIHVVIPVEELDLLQQHEFEKVRNYARSKNIELVVSVIKGKENE